MNDDSADAEQQLIAPVVMRRNAMPRRIIDPEYDHPAVVIIEERLLPHAMDLSHSRKA